MRIVVVPSRYPTRRWPAAGSFVREQVRALALRHDVAVLYPFAVGREEVSEGLWAHPLLRSEDDGVPFVRPRVSLLPQAAYSEFGFLARWASAVAKGLDHLVATWHRPDVVHAHVSCPAGAAAARAASKRGIPVVLTEHTVTGRAAISVERARCMAEGFGGADATVAVSPFLAADIERFASEQGIVLRRPVRVVGNVFDAARFNPGKRVSRDSVSLLAIGNLLPVKGHRYLLRALALVHDRSVDGMTLTIVGSGPEREALQAEATTLGLRDVVRFVPALYGEDLVEAYRSTDVFVLPSLVETFSMVVLEALACGVPVVATRCGGADWVVDESCGFLVEPGSPESLARGIVAAIGALGTFDPGALHRSVASRFGVDAFNDALFGVYREVLESQGAEDGGRWGEIS